MKKVLIIFIISILIINLVYAEMLTSEAGVKYDSQILDEFTKIKNNQINETFVKLMIYLKNISEAENLVSNFNDTEIKNIINRKISDRISVDTTEEGFFKLTQDDRIERIYYNTPINSFEKDKILNFGFSFYIIKIWLIIIFAWIILIYILINKIKIFSKKIHLIFLVLIIFQIILLIISSIFLTRNCGSPCDTHSPIDPFGHDGKEKECIRISLCLPPAPHPVTFIFVDVLILTILTYFILLIPNRIKLKNKTKQKSIFLLILIISFLILPITSANPNLSEKTTIEKWKDNLTLMNKEILQDNLQRYEPIIIEEFSKLKFPLNESVQTNNTFVKLIVYLNNISEAENVISKFNNTEIKNIINRKISDRISVDTTEEGFFKLIQDDKIERIYYNAPTSTFLDKSAFIINATYVWNNFNYTGKGIKVCIIDSGVDKYHPALAGKVVNEYCYCSDVEKNLSSCCPDGTSEDNNASDNFGHGTHVTGIIASQDETYRGIAYNASVYAVKTQNSSGNGYILDMGDAIEWCITQGVNIISMSLGSGGPYNETNSCPQTIDVDINNASAHNISVIAASGNDFYINGIAYPACQINITSVGATTKQDTITDYTNRWNNLDLLALGGVWDEAPAYSEIVSVFSQRVRNDNNLCFLYTYYWWWPWWPLSGCRDDNYDVDNYFIRASGTSQATPHVAGAVALMLEKNSTLKPNEIRQILQNTGKIIWDPDTNRTYPRIDIAAAIEQVPFCNVSFWTAGNCGEGGCTSPKRVYTRICNPSNCCIEGESKCEYDVACESGGGLGTIRDITVCSSGCNSTTINGAISLSDENDRVYVIDSRNYNEQVVMNSTSSGWLKCQNGSRIKGSGTGIGIYVINKDGFIISDCIIDSFAYGIYSADSRHADIINVTINNSGVIGLLLKNDSFDIRIKNINVLETTGDNAVRYDGYEWSSNVVSYNKLEDSVVKKSGAAELIWINWGMYNDFFRNNFSEGATGYEGLLLYGHNNFGYHDISDNNIFNNDIGIYFKDSKNNNINENNFCPSNNNDFSISGSSTGNAGDNNRCEKPGSWNDAGTTGCTYYCDNPPIVTLLYPPNNFVEDGNVDLVCEATDDYKLINVTLYHTISGTWQINETRNISGTSNITTFTFNNIPDGSSFSWNCLAFDNSSRGSFANANWSINISVIPNDTYKFYIKNELNEPVAWLGNSGNIVLKGKCFFNITCDITGDNNSFIIRNSTDDNVAFINSTGDLCIEKGDCSDQSATCNPNRNAFIIRNLTNSNASYIDFDGDLCLTGKLYQNSNPS